MVRDKLESLNLAYEDVIVPDFRPSRRQVFDVSGQYYVPVLKDGDKVLTETREILAYLDKRYGECQGHEARGEGQERAHDATSNGDDAPCCSL